jgi:hypothetical protein
MKINFTPSRQAVTQFQIVADGKPYSVTVPFSAAGQRYYVQIKTNGGKVVLTRPLVAGVNMLFGAFNKTTMTYNAAGAYFEIL